jgi:hypothetical protein
MADFTSSRTFCVAGARPASRTTDVDHLMIYDTPCSLPGVGFAHLGIYGLEGRCFVPRGEAGAFIAERNTVPGSGLPPSTKGGGLSYCIRPCTHSR